jgi:hypothetical protein
MFKQKRERKNRSKRSLNGEITLKIGLRGVSALKNNSPGTCL